MLRKTNRWFFMCSLFALALILLLTGQVLALDAPDPPVLSSPAHGAFIAGTSVDLEWEAPAGATHYMVWVFNLSTDQLLYFEMVEGAAPFTVEGLPDNGEYIAWSVVAGDAGTGLWGDFAVPRIFQSGTDKAMPPPTLVSPADGINISGTTVDFEWDAPEGALAYHIAIINNTTGELLHFNERLFLGHEKEFTFDGLPDNGDTILWTVVAAIDVGVWSDFAFPRTFVNETLIVPEHITVVSTDPADGAVDVSVDSNIVVTFDQNIQVLDMGEIFIPNASLDVTIDNNQLIFEPDAGMDYQLDYGFTYTVQIGVDAVAWTGDANVKLADPYEFSFTTEEAQPYPHFKVDPDNSNIWGHEWPAEIGISVTIGDPSNPAWFEDTQTNEWGDFDFWRIDFEILPGQLVTVTDGVTTKEHTVTALRNVAVDPDTNTISGEAEAGSEVNVLIHDGPHQVVTAAGDGSWEWLVDPAVFDITAGTSGIAWQSDDDWDETHIHWYISNPEFAVDPDNNHIWGHHWAPEAEITISINGGINGESTTVTATDYGHFWIDLLDKGMEVNRGDLVEVNDGDTFKEHLVKHLYIDEVNEAENTISGRAAPESYIQVEIFVGDSAVYQIVQADGVGNWLADFDGLYNIGLGDEGQVEQSDEDFDRTSVRWHVKSPHFNVDPKWNNVYGWEWKPDTEITISIDNAGEDFKTMSNEWGDFWLELHDDYDIQAGDVVTVTDDHMTWSHTVTDLTVTEVDHVNNIVRGTAASESWVNVEVHLDNGHHNPFREVFVDDGTWEVDFTGDYNIGPGSRGDAYQRDDNGNATSVFWRVSQPHFWVDKYHNGIDGDEWLAGAIIQVSIEEHTDELGWVEVDSGETEANQWGYFGLHQIEHKIETGNRVTVSDGVTTKEHIVTELRDVSVDPETNTVSGKAEEGTEVYVHIHEHDAPYRVVTVEPDGTWMVSFDEALGEEPWQRAYDIGPGTRGSADQFDEDGDQTTYFWYVPSPFFLIAVDPGHNNIWGHEWPADTELSVTINRGTNLGIFSETIQSNEWGDFNFDGIDFEAETGDVVTVTDSVEEITHTVKYLEITLVDDVENIIYGKSEPASWVEVEVHLDGWHDIPRRLVQADSEGNWNANFDEPGDGDCPCFQITYDIGPGSRGSADRWEDDRSAATRIHWRIELPHFNVDPDNSNIWGHEWPEYTGISVTIEEEDGVEWKEVWSGSTTTNEWGDFDFSNIEFEILPGHLVTVTDGVTTKEHTITALRNVVADPDTNTISGEAAAGSEVDVLIHDGPHQVVTAAGDGTWEWVVAPGDFDITAGTSGIAWQSDDDRDETHIHWHVPNPRLGVNPVTNVIYGFDWACGAEITITVNGVEYITQAGEGDEGWITCRDFRFKDEALDIEAGNEITVTDGETTRVYTVTSLQITEVDYENDKIIGTAEANSDVNVAVWGDPRKERHETADGDGNWVADFSVAVGDEPWQDAHNIEAFNAGSAYQLDDAGNYTVIHWQVPVIRATVDGNNTIIGYGWTCGTEITIIDGSGTEFTTYAGLGLEGELLADCGEFWFEDPELVISAGDKITVTDGIVTKELDIVNLVLTDINATDDTVSGTADDGIEIVVFVGSGDEWFMRNVTAEGGSWFADFSVSVGDEPWEQAHDITTGDEVWIQNRDEYGDATTIIAEVE